MIRVGLTGGLGTGKTTVLRMFAALGARVLESDAAVHAELRRNKDLKKKIRHFFGPQVFCGSAVSAPRLALRAFSSKKDLKKLNSLVHPLVKGRIFGFFEAVAKGRRRRLAVVEVPLLYEAGFDRFFDTTVVVTAVPSVQRRRMLEMSRFSPADIRRRMRWQWPLARKVARSDFVIDNTGNKTKTFQQVKELKDFLLKSFEDKEVRQWKRKK